MTVLLSPITECHYGTSGLTCIPLGSLSLHNLVKRPFSGSANLGEDLSLVRAVVGLLEFLTANRHSPQGFICLQVCDPTAYGGPSESINLMLQMVHYRVGSGVQQIAEHGPIVDSVVVTPCPAAALCSPFVKRGGRVTRSIAHEWEVGCSCLSPETCHTRKDWNRAPNPCPGNVGGLCEMAVTVYRSSLLARKCLAHNTLPCDTVSQGIRHKIL